MQLLCNQNEALTLVTSDLTLGADGLAQLRCLKGAGPFHPGGQIRWSEQTFNGIASNAIPKTAKKNICKT